MSTPQSTIYICENVRLNSRYEHTIYFADLAAQEAYFRGKVVKTFSAYTFIRKSWDLNVAATMEEADSWSYLFFANVWSGKKYFYFIDNIEYVNDGTVRLKLQIDVMQTYLYEYKNSLLPCFIERQHVEDDTIGLHTVDEGLETGELIDNAITDATGIEDLCILVLSTINPNFTDTVNPVPALAGMYNNVFSGLKVWAIDSAKWADWGNKLDDLSEAGFSDGIISMWMYPKSLVTLGGENTWSDDVLCKIVDSFSKDVSVNRTKYYFALDGYEPKNNKLYCHPFNFLYCSNNHGGSAIFKYERFKSGSIMKFKLYGSVSPDAPVLLTPLEYNCEDENFDQSLTLANFPTCAWDSDVYKMWLAQNQNQQTTATMHATQSVVGGIVGVGAGLLTGNIGAAVGGAGVAISGARQIETLNAQKRDMAIQPPQSKGNFSTNINITAGKQTFTFYNKSVSKEYAAIIDDFFTMYGYRINRVQTPNIHTRKSHTYIKTVGCHIDSNLCNEDATKIEAIFDNGVTFWVDGDRIGQYGDDNSTL